MYNKTIRFYEQPLYGAPRPCLVVSLSRPDRTTTTKIEKRQVYPIHPIIILPDELQALNMYSAVLARQTHVSSNRIYQIISGKRAITAVTCLRLEQWLDVEVAFWMSLQNTYELDLAIEKSGEKIKKTVQSRASPSSVQAVVP